MPGDGTPDRRPLRRLWHLGSTANGVISRTFAAAGSSGSRKQSGERRPAADAIPITDAVVPADADVLKPARARGKRESHPRPPPVEEPRDRAETVKLAPEPGALNRGAVGREIEASRGKGARYLPGRQTRVLEGIGDAFAHQRIAARRIADEKHAGGAD